MKSRRSVAFVSLFCTMAVVPSACTESSSSGNAHPHETGGSSAEGGEGGQLSSGGAAAATGAAPNTGGKKGDPSSGGQVDSGGEGGMTEPMDGCGPSELCDPLHLGVDDDCNGSVDEGCVCAPGAAHACFKGDPDKRNAPGCFDGSEVCTEEGAWGPCVGGRHDFGDDCSALEPAGCHALFVPPYAQAALSAGLGTFGDDALPGSDSFSIACPPGASTCPSVAADGSYKPLQSGEYTVTYTKSVAGSPNPLSCSYPLVVRGGGLRVELSWEHSSADSGVDLDLHLHQPSDTSPWGVTAPSAHDCTWSNCRASNFQMPYPDSPSWFNGAAPPAAVSWYLNPVADENTCFGAPRGDGALWKAKELGCHNPRLDADTITCDASVTDPENTAFCFPENVNVDFPPTNQWMRIGVHYYGNQGLTYDVHPEIKVFCGGELAARLGPAGYYSPQSPVTFEPADGVGGPSNTRFWSAADVIFVGEGGCVVAPIYSDPVQKTPYFTTGLAASTSFAPPYPALP